MFFQFIFIKIAIAIQAKLKQGISWSGTFDCRIAHIFAYIPSITRCAKFETCDVVLPKEFSARRFGLLFQLHFHRAKPVAAAANGSSVSLSLYLYLYLCVHVCTCIYICQILCGSSFVLFFAFSAQLLLFVVVFVLPFLSKDQILFSSFSWGPMHFG